MIKKFEDYSKNEQLAILKLYTRIGHDFGEKQEIIDRINNDLKYDYLTDHELNKETYFWYLDENVSFAINVDTFQIYEDDEIDFIF